MPDFGLVPPLASSHPIKDLERIWLNCACAYEVFDDPLMSDELWDALGRELWARKMELSPYFCHAVGLPWPVPADHGEEGENPLKTASGIPWDAPLSIAKLCCEALRMDMPRRVAKLVRMCEAAS